MTPPTGRAEGQRKLPEEERVASGERRKDRSGSCSSNSKKNSVIKFSNVITRVVVVDNDYISTRSPYHIVDQNNRSPTGIG